MSNPGANWAPLVAVWPSLSAGTTDQKIAQLAAMTVQGPNVPVPLVSVVDYLAEVGKLAGLKTYAANPPATEAGVAATQFFILMTLQGYVFPMNLPATYASVQGFLNAWASDANTGITSADVTAILALAAGAPSPWWQANNYGSPITVADATAAGLS